MKKYNHNEFIRLRDSNFYDSYHDERATKYDGLKSFREAYSVDFIKIMKIEDYVQGLGNNDNFCYHIERTFGCFGCKAKSNLGIRVEP